MRRVLGSRGAPDDLLSALKAAQMVTPETIGHELDERETNHHGAKRAGENGSVNLGSLLFVQFVLFVLDPL
jgi:hypothetical protein